MRVQFRLVNVRAHEHQVFGNRIVAGARGNVLRSQRRNEICKVGVGKFINVLKRQLDVFVALGFGVGENICLRTDALADGNARHWRRRDKVVGCVVSEACKGRGKEKRKSKLSFHNSSSRRFRGLSPRVRPSASK